MKQVKKKNLQHVKVSINQLIPEDAKKVSNFRNYEILNLNQLFNSRISSWNQLS